MNWMKRFSIYILIALLTIVNLNYYRCNAVPTAKHIDGRDGSTDRFELQNSTFFSFMEQRGDLQIQFSNFQKIFFKITFQHWSLDKVSFIIKKIHAQVCYLFLSHKIVPGLEKTDIIFPFHYFW